MKHTLPLPFSKSHKAVAMLLGLIATGAQANTLQGQIGDAQNKALFEGAHVKIVELNKQVSSSRDGRFIFTQIPAGNYTLEVSYIGAQSYRQTVKIDDKQVTTVSVVLEPLDSEVDNIIVVGQRAGQAGALNRQKNADGIMTIVSADSIGQLPDQNAAEALQRLPGMFIQRDQGEGRFVGIRGIDPGLNNVSINGANVPSPEAGIRSVAMDVIPSEIIQSLEVSKTVTPDMDASAIGGSINVKSLSAFDRQGQSYSFTAQGSHNELVNETSPKLSASFSDIYDLATSTQLGVATAVSWFERKFGSHNMETDGGWMLLEQESAETGEDVEFFGAEEIEQRHYQVKRERLGAALNLDLHQGAMNKYYLRTLYSEFSDDEFRKRNEYRYDKGKYLTAESSDTAAYFSDAEMDRDTKDRYEEQSILSVVAGAEHILNSWFIEYNLGYSKSDEAEPNRLDVDFAAEALTLGYASLGDTPTLSHPPSAHDLSHFSMDEIVWEDNLSEDEAISFKLDISKDFVLNGYNAQFKAGVKYSDREKLNRVNAKVYDGGFDDITAQQFAIDSPEFDLGDFGPGLSRQGIRSYFSSNQAGFDLNVLESDIESKGKSYTSQETVSALYAMLSLDVGDLNVITGLRYEDTEYDTVGSRVELLKNDIEDSERVAITPWEVSKNYDHLLPNLTMRYAHSDSLITRFAYTQTIARPSFGDAAAFQLLESETTLDDDVVQIERKGEVGNPNLNPYEASNIDFSIEYYPGKIGVLSAGLFHKNIDNYIAKKQVQDNGLWDGFEEVIQSVNGGEAELSGLELAYTKNFDNGLMISANGTFIDADDALPNQSDTVANLMIGYESSLLSARLSNSYKSKSYIMTENDGRVYQDAHNQIDFSVKYYISEQTQVYFNALNLTDEPLYVYHAQPRYNYQYESYGRSYQLGITLSSF
ncbi:TonB-dependent receptor [Pseudoalteromonas luteoviolacea]|uniref:TonB-dependent receptor n=1 Tax=Pseudoalteromonas luteoviolacea TaxID=43657 RepID=UPI001B38AE65|nr:TonB-dependent receptor [Pseudoalteromonas luteoviolacea]MBQ4835851.1 TonB-dependent receptor [Pseudoalteromonas luteoviolacea]